MFPQWCILGQSFLPVQVQICSFLANCRKARPASHGMETTTYVCCRESDPYQGNSPSRLVIYYANFPHPGKYMPQNGRDDKKIQVGCIRRKSRLVPSCMGLSLHAEVFRWIRVQEIQGYEHTLHHKVRVASLY